MSNTLHPDTLAIRTQVDKSEQREHSVPLYLTSSFVFDDAEQMRALFSDEIDGNIYSRFSNPNCQEFISKLCLLEKTEDGISTATGMAAVFVTFMGLLKAGDHIVSTPSVFGSTHTLFTKILPRFGITHSYIDINNPDVWKNAIKTETRLFFCETPSNPGLDIVDLEQVGTFCKENNLIFCVDNCFATSVLQTPSDFGADIIIHSATKYIDGQGRVLGGAVVGKKEYINQIRFFSRHSGPALSPFNAWVLSKSLETLSLRMEKHCENAELIFNFLQKHPAVEKVIYPFSETHPQYAIARKQMKRGGGIVSFIIKGGISSGKKFIDSLNLCSRSANLGDTRTIITHPASTTHSKLTEDERLAVGILPGLIRVSVGLEHSDDIINDINTSLELSKS